LNIPAVDTILVNGRITTLAVGPAAEAQALAVRAGRIVAVGSDEDVRALVSSGTSVVDVGGRRVVPGLIDSHVHFVRAGRTWNDELRWSDVYSLDAGLELVAQDARRRGSGRWVRVIGGWNEHQFAEGRGPTREELDAVAPDNPVYVQMGYEWAQLNTRAMQAIGLTDEVARSVHPEQFDRDADGRLTGRGHGMELMKWFYRQLPTPTFEEQVASTSAASRAFARLGLTGVIDGGGVNTGPDAYAAVYEAWRRDLLVTRVRLLKHASEAGKEHEEFAGYARYDHPRFGDDMMRVAGAGEIFLYKSHDDIPKPADSSPEALAEVGAIFETFAAKGWPVQIHAYQREFILGLIEQFERVDAKHPIQDLRWGIVHAESVRPQDVPRLQRLGAGILVQSLFRFNGEYAIEAWGAERVAQSPPLRAFLDAGIPVALGSDATRVASYNPFTSLQFFLTGTTVKGTPTWAEENLLSRLEALRGYTHAGAWFTHDDQHRGTLEPGKFADLAVLSDDYFEVPTEEVHRITSDLTLVGGEIAWASAAAERWISGPAVVGLPD
jgi:predicted amidohydrolase YtcJ